MAATAEARLAKATRIVEGIECGGMDDEQFWITPALEEAFEMIADIDTPEADDLRGRIEEWT